MHLGATGATEGPSSPLMTNVPATLLGTHEPAITLWIRTVLPGRPGSWLYLLSLTRATPYTETPPGKPTYFHISN